MVSKGEASFLEAALQGCPQLPLLLQQLLGAVRRGYYISSGNSAKNERKSTICGFLGGMGWCGEGRMGMGWQVMGQGN